MNEKEIEAYLHQHIPVSKAMGIQVECVSSHEVILQAPFSNNINHKQTVFGGSLHAVATLACWTFLHFHLKDLNPLDLVITHSHVDYLLPVTSDFKVSCPMPENDTWQRFIKLLKKKGKGRIELHAKIFQNEKLAVDYTGTFAALERQKTELTL